MKDSKLGYVTLKTMVLSNTLPSNFVNYALADKNGRSLAHIAAAIGALPNWFRDYHISDKNGWTVAHAHVGRSKVSESFQFMDLADKNGLTVRAHAEACDNIAVEVVKRNIHPRVGVRKSSGESNV